MRAYIKVMIFLLLSIFATQQLKAQNTPNISYPGPQVFVAGSQIAPLTIVNTGGAAVVNGQTSTFAGSGTAGAANGTGTAATFNQPSGIVVSSAGVVYVAETGNDKIRKITAAGVVSTLAGSGTVGSANGTGTAASFNNPKGLAMDGSGNIYVADYSNNLIRKITAAGVVTTFAGSGTAGAANGTGTAASFNLPVSLAIDASGNVYVSDYGNHLIRKITSAGVVTTFAGSGTAGAANGTGTAASFNHPFGITLDASGNLYVADQLNNMVRKISSTGVVTTLAGSSSAGNVNGAGTAARFSGPVSITNDAAGNIYVGEMGNYDIRAITPSGQVTTLSGAFAIAARQDGQGSIAAFNYPFCIDADKYGNIFVADYNNNEIRKTVTTAFAIVGTLPSGLVLNTATGTITGKPVTVSAPVSYAVAAYNSYGADTAAISIEVDPGGVINPTQYLNYITIYTPRVPGLLTSTGLDSASTDKSKLQATVQYFDGIGRPIQTVQVKASPTGHDMVIPVTYDQFGRELIKYDPYPITGTLANDGSFKPTAVADQSAFYAAPVAGVRSNTFPYAETLEEPSVIGRPLEQGASGDNWQLTGKPGASSPGHTIKMVYTTNNNITWATDSVNSLQVALYQATINSNQSRTLISGGHWSSNQLDVTITKDENWVSGRAGTSETYTDKEGHVVLKRVYNYTATLEVLSTYYVYDDLGNLAYVLPPSANGDLATSISKTTLDNLCYQYRYDIRNRLSQKKIPGKGWEFTVYNILDQPVASQDSLLRLMNNWIITKYDALGRAIGTAIWNNNNVAVAQTTLQTTLNGITTNLWEKPDTTVNSTGYTLTAWPTTYITAILSVNYYDNYVNIPGVLADHFLNSADSKMTTGLLTGKKTAVLNNTNDVLWYIPYYDDLGRVVTTYSQHYLGGTANTNNYDLTKLTYNFTNEPVSSVRQHFTSANTTVPLVTVANSYVYDHVGRRLKNWEQLTQGNNAPNARTLLSMIDYNEISQVRYKHLHSTDSVNFLQNITYAYNERGWMTIDSSNLFAMQLYYNTGSIKSWNGNIMYQYWGTPLSLSNHCTYSYDKLNRLKSGISSANNNESGISYDLEGNITALARTQTGTSIDNLTYTYNNTNQLQSVNDASGNNAGLNSGVMNYVYDGNGNVQSSSNSTNTSQNKSYTYNLLNLPQAVTLPSGTVTYTYNAEGKKLRKVSVFGGNTTTTDYIDGIQYKTDGTIDFIQTEEGRALNNAGNYHYEYSLADNLGNERATFDTYSGGANLVQRDDYYPFGMEISSGTTVSPKNEYLYNKKELQEELGMYDYGARFYDPVIARWTSVDPLAEQGRRWTPYGYGLDNPVRYEDPDGMWPWDNLFKKVKNYVVNKVKEVATNAVVNIGDAVIKKVKSLEATVYFSGSVKASGSVGIAAKVKGVGVSAHYRQHELLNLSVDGSTNVKTKKTTINSEAYYDGKDGNYKETSGGGVDAGVGGEYEKEQTTNSNGDVVDTKKTASVSASVPFVGVEDVVSSDNGRKSISSGLVSSGSAGWFLIFSFDVHIGVKISEPNPDK